jgi:DNA-binding LytR/AlgR family response regulator
VDFINKPIKSSRFQDAVQKVIEVEELKQKSGSEEGFIYVKSNGKLTRVEYTDILFIESMKDYVKIRTKAGRLVVHSTLKKMQETLEPDGRFVRVHRSFICNVNQVADFLKNEIIVGEYSLPVSRAHKQGLLVHLREKSA